MKRSDESVTGWVGVSRPSIKICPSCTGGQHFHARDDECYLLYGELGVACKCREAASSRSCGRCHQTIFGPYAISRHFFYCADCAKTRGYEIR